MKTTRLTVLAFLCVLFCLQPALCPAQDAEAPDKPETLRYNISRFYPDDLERCAVNKHTMPDADLATRNIIDIPLEKALRWRGAWLKFNDSTVYVWKKNERTPEFTIDVVRFEPYAGDPNWQAKITIENNHLVISPMPAPVITTEDQTNTQEQAPPPWIITWLVLWCAFALLGTLIGLIDGSGEGFAVDLLSGFIAGIIAGLIGSTLSTIIIYL